MKIFKKKNQNGEIISFDSLILRENGMRGSYEYHLVYGEEFSCLEFYFVRFGGGTDDSLELDKSKQVDNGEVLRVLNECKVLDWNGFDGKHPRGVLDGIMFNLVANVNGKELKASGSENFPKHYKEFVAWMNGILSE